MSDVQERFPRIRKDISLGNILTIIGMIAAGFAAWMDVRTTQTKILTQQSDFERRMVVLEAAELSQRTNRLQQATLFTELRSDIRYLREDIAFLREGFERIEQSPRPH
ncbi:MAG: hypothetical protein AAFY12_12475 [Pseudomonadota bacterium]